VRYTVFLPQNVTIELETEGVTRPKVVVYETTRLGKQKSLMYLQLVMMAGKYYAMFYCFSICNIDDMHLLRI